MDPGEIEPPGPRAVAWSRTGTGQAEMGTHFAHSSLDLGKTSLIKHQIELMDQMPFKEHYWCIPPHMYDDVKAHLQEMLDIDVIR